MAYSKLKAFDRKQTNWQGLWYHDEYHGFSSAALSLAELRKFKGKVRLFVYKNKFYEKDSNRPNYVFRIMDADAEVFNTVEVEDMEEEERLYTEDEVQSILDRVGSSLGGGHKKYLY